MICKVIGDPLGGTGAELLRGTRVLFLKRLRDCSRSQYIKMDKKSSNKGGVLF